MICFITSVALLAQRKNIVPKSWPEIYIFSYCVNNRCDLWHRFDLGCLILFSSACSRKERIQIWVCLKVYSFLLSQYAFWWFFPTHDTFPWIKLAWVLILTDFFFFSMRGNVTFKMCKYRHNERRIISHFSEGAEPSKYLPKTIMNCKFWVSTQLKA